MTKVADDSPAERAGIVAGDMILRLDRGAIYSIEDLLSEIHNRKIGDRSISQFIAEEENKHSKPH